MNDALLAAVILIILVAGSAYSGWWAREFVYTLEHVTVRGCDTEGSCGDR